jgi:hypothetical protein
MKLVALYGEDGFDLDVLTNQIALYRSLGCRVVWSKKYVPCDLWVILRGKTGNFIPIPKDQPCLFLDYSGHDVLAWFQSSTVNHKLCITSQKHAENQEQGIFFGHPFVSIQDFQKEVAPLRYTKVHIGSYKNDPLRDPDLIDFHSELERNACVVWGKYWDKVALQHAEWKGPLSPKKVSSVYAQSLIALGCKYQHQQGKAISGRYWQAPLNGCALWADDSYLIDELPGVYPYGTTNLPSRNELQDTATNYWKAQNQLQTSLSTRLLTNPRPSTSSRAYWYRHALIGALYRAYRIFTYR